MKLEELQKRTEIFLTQKQKELEFSGISYDSRTVKPGDLFICLKGYTSDGHKFAKDAKDKGALIIAAQKNENLDVNEEDVIRVENTRAFLSHASAAFYHDPSKKLQVFGVTGTNGKTTITYMLHKILETRGEDCGVIGTISYKIGQHVYESVNTTPESYELQKMFAEMVEYKNKACVMEVSSHSLSMSRVEDVDFDYGIFTNLTPDHLDFHPDFEAYYAAKKKLFYLVGKQSVINMDDKYGKRMLEELRAEGISCCSFSAINEAADYYGVVLEKTDTYSVIQISKNQELLGNVKINIPGLFSVYNALAAVSVCIEAGMDFETITKGIEELHGVPGRFELVKNDRNIVAIVDYAHTPDALEKVLSSAQDFKKGRLICVFGCGGDRDKTKRPLMGRVAGELADYCIITSDNPRTEDTMQILDHIEEGIYGTGCNYEIIENRLEAIQKAIDIYKKGDVLILAGKGHEDYQIIGTTKYHFDDKEMVKSCIEKRDAHEKA